MDADLGLLIIRLALGPMLVAHGLNKVLGPGGLSGTQGWFENLGRRPHGFTPGRLRSTRSAPGRF